MPDRLAGDRNLDSGTDNPSSVAERDTARFLIVAAVEDMQPLEGGGYRISDYWAQRLADFLDEPESTEV